LNDHLTCDVAIIGGGIAGLCAAFAIARRGRTVVLLEQDRVGSKASGVNFGGCRTNGRDLLELPLSQRSQSIWHQFDAYAGDWCEYRMTGHLEVTTSDDGMAAMEAWAAKASDFGVTARMLSASHLRAEHGYLSQRLAGGCFVADNGSANPRLVVPQVARRAQACGARIVEHARVVAAEPLSSGGFRLATVAGVAVSAPLVIHATGGYSGQTAGDLFGEAFPVERIVAQMVVSEPAAVRIAPVIDFPLLGRYLYLRQTERGNILFGRGSGNYDPFTDRAAFLGQNLFDSSAVAAQLIPGLGHLNVLRTWGGLDGAMPDWMPVLGFSGKHEGLIHAFGFSGHGFQLGPATGEVLAELALDGKTPTDISGFKPNRFAHGLRDP